MSALAIPKPARRSPKPPRRIARKSRPAKVRKTSVAKLKRKLWTLVARYVLDRDGRVCVTCGGVADQAGHFYSRGIASTWIDPKNLGAQCARCNLFLQGNPGAFASYIVFTYDRVELQRLTDRANRETKHWTADELERLIEAIKVGGAEFEMAYYETNL